MSSPGTGSATPYPRRKYANLTRAEAEQIAVDIYGGHPGAADVLLEAVPGETDTRCVKSSDALS